MERLNVLVTGPGGRVGPHILPQFRQRYNLRLLDRNPIPGEPDTVIADLQDQAVLREALQGVDVLVHLAAQADEAPFLEVLVPNNVVGLYNTFQAAHEAGVRRIVFASTVQVTATYPPDVTVEVTDPVRPITLYAATKVLGEVMGRWYHDHQGMEFIAIRIGAFQPYDSDRLREWAGMRELWLSPRDCANILCAAVEKPGIGYAIVYATSKTARERVSLRPLREVLGYEPQDDIRRLLPDLYPETGDEL